MNARLDSALDAAKSWVGLGASARDPARYSELLFPRDTPAYARAAAASMSSCGLVAAAFLRALGVKHPHLDCAYEGRCDAMATVVQVARDLGCWVVPNQDSEPPNVGDCVLIGRNGDPSYGVPPYEHFFVVADYEPEDGSFVCVEGGQGEHGASIGESHRVFLWRGDALWAVRAAQPLTAASNPNGRRCQGYMSAALLLPKLEPDTDTDLAALPAAPTRPAPRRARKGPRGGGAFLFCPALSTSRRQLTRIVLRFVGYCPHLAHPGRSSTVEKEPNMPESLPPESAGFEVAIEGVGLSPSEIGLHQLEHLIKATAKAVEAVAKQGNMTLNADDFHLIDIRTGSAAYAFTSQADFAPDVVVGMEDLLRSRGRSAGAAGIDAVRHLHDAGKPFGAIRFTARGAPSVARVPIHVSPPLESKRTGFESVTEVYAHLLGVKRGKKGLKVTLRHDDGREEQFLCEDVPREKLLGLFDKPVRARVSYFIRGDESRACRLEDVAYWAGADMDILDVFAAAREELAEQGIHLRATDWLDADLEEGPHAR